MHGVNICLVLAILLITIRLDPGWGLGQALYTMSYYLLFCVLYCHYDSFSSIRIVRYFSSSCLFVCYVLYFMLQLHQNNYKPVHSSYI